MKLSGNSVFVTLMLFRRHCFARKDSPMNIKLFITMCELPLPIFNYHVCSTESVVTTILSVKQKNIWNILPVQNNWELANRSEIENIQRCCPRFRNILVCSTLSRYALHKLGSAAFLIRQTLYMQPDDDHLLTCSINSKTLVWLSSKNRSRFVYPLESVGRNPSSQNIPRLGTGTALVFYGHYMHWTK